MLRSSFSGVCFDVTRLNEKHFSYNTLEQIKSGFVMSGKYKGTKRLFDPVPVVVFANFAPELNKLSADRWQIFNIETVPSTSSIPLFEPNELFPFIRCPELPMIFWKI